MIQTLRCDFISKTAAAILYSQWTRKELTLNELWNEINQFHEIFSIFCQQSSNFYDGNYLKNVVREIDLFNLTRFLPRLL